MQKRTINLRLVLVCIAAVSVGLPIAIISLAKTLLLVGGALVLLFRPSATPSKASANELKLTTYAILTVLLAFSASLLWTTGTQAEAYNSLAKYGKLLMIPLIVMLLRSRVEAVCALAWFAAAQLVLLASSWMLYFQLPVPWATSLMALTHHSVFSSYLDQGLMTAVFAGLCWHLRALVPGRFGQRFAIVIAVLALFNVFFVLMGRSGHAVAIALISLAIMWAFPVKYRAPLMLLPLVLLLVVVGISPEVRVRLAQVKNEVQAFSFTKGENLVTGSSSGIRLHLWHRALQSILEKPVFGSGVGSWSSEFNRIERQENTGTQTIAEMSNPHQEYLLWGVQLGIAGIFLFLGLLLSIYRDTQHLDKKARHAAQSVLAALAVACLFNSTLYDGLIGDFFCVALGLLLALGIHKTTPPAEQLKVGRYA